MQSPKRQEALRRASQPPLGTAGTACDVHGGELSETARAALIRVARALGRTAARQYLAEQAKSASAASTKSTSTNSSDEEGW
jgi:hypothetical protein